MTNDETPDADADEGDEVSFSVTIEDSWTTIVMEGDKDTAVVVRSASGERIYLPPEDFATEQSSDSASQRSDSPYQTAYDSPYQSVQTDDSPYQSARGTMPREGMVPTRGGYRIRHPEPVTDVRLLR
ncbi:hypothetical protein E6P09_10105 [Haloferax mediterranei ATCC 33500]|uniref:Uncharacterized protein n=1 Tax=Haloferax mediterranei (strain ATCC 33500 / DSM 1411 / JCM 8866 / NBRC 14739 / NCIMB 2177 / R-4) TaxID=523841 RepID=I3R4G6_HALMT|nr:hypothetical protein [Haloferax mediterranei]AFK19126.1 hypothetical protein HFX_1416 [Haloferax mediterranei ATCC 33500]AHZ21513.1 hypothetical protein BM92_02080 [Haloferax mediterranei ATCC 33500]EMA03973.1 hypothetical protein C439_03408 [Haloferax mediterranei ATCC 33500]MDX5989222.1 hypothetical protein [Haloferax mediterranei ATCC 33500]QCQ75598.1 hypothetical protein E6P09_10105 [Haloferax mediterranei ATCC 33500]